MQEEPFGVHNAFSVRFGRGIRLLRTLKRELRTQKKFDRGDKWRVGFRHFREFAEVSEQLLWRNQTINGGSKGFSGGGAACCWH